MIFNLHSDTFNHAYLFRILFLFLNKSSGSARPGEIKWLAETNTIGWSSPAIGPDAAVYITTNDRRLWAFNPDGKIKWYFDTAHENRITPVFANNGLIVFGSEDGYLHRANKLIKKTLIFIFVIVHQLCASVRENSNLYAD
jgi:hypothetical protein